jgi:hypothetical protein
MFVGAEGRRLRLILCIVPALASSLQAPRRSFGELRVSWGSARETSRGVKAGPRTGPRRRVRVSAPEQEQGVRADRDDDIRADGVARPAGGEYEGSRADAAATCIGGSAVLRAELVRAPFRYPSERQSHATVATIAALALVMTGRFPASGIGRAAMAIGFSLLAAAKFPHW